jgi:error-prone DNA polymerase
VESFTHLHVSSGFSLRHGVSHPAALVEAAANQDMDMLGLTDRDGVYGAVRFATACRAAGLRPVLGVELAVEPSGVLSRPRRPTAPSPGRVRRAVPARGGVAVDPGLSRVTLLAHGRSGWASLCRLVSAAHAAGERGRPVLTRSTLLDSAGRGGLVVLLGPSSEVGTAIAGRRPDLAERVLSWWREVMDAEDLRIEVVNHQAAGGGPGLGTRTHAAHSLGWARDVGATAVLTNQVRYARPDQAAVADVLDATRRLVPLDVRHLDRRNAQGYLKSTAAMHRIAEDVSTDAGLADGRNLVEATRVLAQRCALDPTDLGIGELHFPELSSPGSSPPTSSGLPPWSSGAAATAEAVLRERCAAGVNDRYGPDRRRDVLDRLDEELEMVRRLGYPSYFITVAEVCDMIRAHGGRVAARGSGAGSLICYLLGISGVDPIRHGLLMERFLSPLRQALPDIDIDVESARRLDIYRLIFDRFGQQRVACVAMMDTYRVRHAIRDVGGALGLPPGEIDAFAKAFPHIRARDVRHALSELPELRASGISQALHGERLEMMLSLVEALDGLPRHVAMHPCGVLLSDITLLDRTPVEPSMLGFQMSQFDKDDVEDLGLLKLDVLGVRMQSAMAHAVSEVSRLTGEHIDLDDEACVPHDDPKTFELIRSTRTLGCFQIESPGQRELIGKFAPETFGDIIIDISLFRPGPVKSDMVTPFLMARQGWREPSYLHPDLTPALRETCGVVVFHEQVLRIIATATGCSLAEADEARRALGTIDGKEQVRQWFRPRALAQGYPETVVDRVQEVLAAFASFGFCKAHAAAFALTTFQSAWLKAHHTAAFLAGVLTHDPGMYPKRLILDEARAMQVPILPLDVNSSDVVYRTEAVGGGTYGIRLALSDVLGIAEDEAESVVANRPYSSVVDFWRRSGVSRPVAERLVLLGALDSLVHREGATPTRRDLLLHLADLDRVPSPAPGQLALDLVQEDADVSAGLPELDDAERCRAELDILGMDASHHVLDFYSVFLEHLGITRSADLLSQRSRSHLLVAGVKVATQTPPVRSGRRVVFLTLDDSTGPVDLTFFDDQGHHAPTVFGSWLIVAEGELRRTGPRGVSLRATGCWDLSSLHEIWSDAGGIEAGEKSLRAVGEAMSMASASASARTGGGVGSQPRRVLVHPSGFRQSPYADIRTAGTSAALAPRKVWHASPGSSGR